MCAGGGGGVSKAVITDPLQYTSEYTKANQRVQKIKAKQGRMDPATYQKKLSDAKERRDSVDKYKNKRANKVEDNVDFFTDKIKGLLDKNSTYNLTQDLVNASNEGLRQTLEAASSMATLAAENQQLLQQDAARMAALVGPPPPEKSASAPLIGANREDGVTPGRTRRSLRIDRAEANTLFI